MQIRDWIMRIVMKAPFLDEEKRAAQKTRLEKLQEELDREFAKDGLRPSERTSGFRSVYAAVRDMLERRAEQREAGGETSRHRFDRAARKAKIKAAGEQRQSQNADVVTERRARDSAELKRRIDEAREKLERERIARP
ncbi:hypothetical protein [Methylorubrum extorquens]